MQGVGVKEGRFGVLCWRELFRVGRGGFISLSPK